MVQRRTTHSEQKLLQVEADEAAREPEEGILELFQKDDEPRPEDAPLARDDSSE